MRRKFSSSRRMELICSLRSRVNSRMKYSSSGWRRNVERSFTRVCELKSALRIVAEAIYMERKSMYTNSSHESIQSARKLFIHQNTNFVHIFWPKINNILNIFNRNIFRVITISTHIEVSFVVQ